MIRAVVEHGHEVTVAADQNNAVYGSTINETYNIHTQVEIQVCFFSPAGEGLVVFRRNTVAQSFDRLQKHLLITWLRAGWTIRMCAHKAAIATQEIQQFAEIDSNTQCAC